MKIVDYICGGVIAIAVIAALSFAAWAWWITRDHGKR